MKTGKVFCEVYKYLQTIDEPRFAKHTISAMIVGAFDELETSGQEITPEAIEEILMREFSGFDYKEKSKKVS